MIRLIGNFYLKGEKKENRKKILKIIKFRKKIFKIKNKEKTTKILTN